MFWGLEIIFLSVQKLQILFVLSKEESWGAFYRGMLLTPSLTGLESTMGQSW